MTPNKVIVFPVIVYSDESRAGKDSIGRQLEKYFELSPNHGKAYVTCKRYKFSKPVKDIANKMFGYAGVFPGSTYERSPNLRTMSLPMLGLSNVTELWVKLGKFLTEIGEESMGRACVAEVNKDVQKLYPKVGPGLKTGRTDIGVAVHVPVFTDLRRDVELKVLREKSYTEKPFFVKVVRDKQNTVKNKMDGLLTQEVWDMTIHNTGTEDTLKNIVYSNLIPELRKRVQALAQANQEK